MAVRLVDGGWWEELEAALGGEASTVRIASPFIKHGAVEGLLPETGPSLRILTRFNLDHFREGVSDISALRHLVELGAQVRGVQRLHAKLYLFDAHTAVITSANMTEGGLRKNHELGVVTEGGALPRRCVAYFDALWEKAAPDLVVAKLDEWEERIEAQQIPGAPSIGSGLGDEGANVGAEAEPQLPRCSTSLAKASSSSSARATTGRAGTTPCSRNWNAGVVTGHALIRRTAGRSRSRMAP